MSTFALRSHYRRNGIRLRVVDLHSVNKINRADEIREKQREFVAELRRLQHTK